jgi:hypothetical protein
LLAIDARRHSRLIFMSIVAPGGSTLQAGRLERFRGGTTSEQPLFVSATTGDGG